jgi:hypothetical protein
MSIVNGTSNVIFGEYREISPPVGSNPPRLDPDPTPVMNNEMAEFHARLMEFLEACNTRSHP